MDITRLLSRWADGDRQAFEALMPVVYDEVRRRALSAAGENDSNAMRNVALTDKYLAGHFEGTGDYDASLVHYQRAMALDERRVRQRPDDRQARIDLAIDMGGIAYAHYSRGRHDQALAMYRESLGIRQQLADSDPKDVYARGRVAYVLDQISAILIVTKQFEAAREPAARAAELTESLIGISDEYRAQHAMARLRLGEIADHFKQRAEACRHFTRADALFGQIEKRFMYHDRIELKESVARHVRQCAG